eukprot:TRINITY_DN15398_c0_g1_i1.p1 TRINITY_DN15398_c0_g1~~TRINITY_DN15398_c0_g1_i1.p1  ORF type:complete len:154 (+),score=19.04 TRINITY_DN15398_c0_g1_i1:123-584(+)
MHLPAYYASGVTLFTLTSLMAQPFTLIKRREQVGAIRPGAVYTQLTAIARAEGIAGLFRSAGIAWIPGVSRMIYFTLYESVASNMMRSLPKSHQASKPLALAVAGASCTLVFQFILTPVSVVSARLQLHTGPPLRSAQVARDMYRKHGGVRVF